MTQQIIIAEQARIAALLTDDRVDQLIVAKGQYQIGDIFLGTVENAVSYTHLTLPTTVSV